jgi:drug/metabolite transporter (DMT)-like permease
MPIVLALTAATIWGAADFLGGLASRRSAALQVLFVSQAVGLVAMLVAVAFIGGDPTSGDMAWGVVGGLIGNAGLYGLYRELARGQAGVVAPTTAVSAALTPVVVGLALGEVPGAMTLAGVAIAVIAVGLLAGGEGRHAEPGSNLAAKVRRALHGGFWIAIASGLGFGAFYVCLAQTSEAAGLWPLVASRGASVVALALLPATWRGLRGPRKPPLIPAGTAGLLDATANSAYVVAVRAGSITWVPVLASLYPASTVLLARVFQKQRLGVLHVVGLALALIAIALVAAGSG